MTTPQITPTATAASSISPVTAHQLAELIRQQFKLDALAPQPYRMLAAGNRSPSSGSPGA